MKARRKGTNDAFVEITEVSLKNDPFGLYKISQIEFEQQQEQELIDHWQDLRERAAIAALQGFIAYRWDDMDNIVRTSVKIADTLVERLKGE